MQAIVSFSGCGLSRLFFVYSYYIFMDAGRTLRTYVSALVYAKKSREKRGAKPPMTGITVATTLGNRLHAFSCWLSCSNRSAIVFWTAEVR